MTDTAAFLFAHSESVRKGRTIPQVVYANAEKRALRWTPGNKPARPGMDLSRPPRSTVFTGYTPGAFLFPREGQHEQTVSLCWSGLDIDEHVDEALPLLKQLGDVVSLRTSRSGIGIHAFVRFEEPVVLLPGADRNTILRNVWRPLFARTTPVFDPRLICSWGYRVWYTDGGRNAWLHQAPNTLRVSGLDGAGAAPAAAAPPPPPAPTAPDAPAPGVGEPVAEVVRLLAEAGVRLHMGRNGIYVKAVFEALKGTRWAFETKSPMRSGVAHENGLIVLTPTEFVLIPNADGRPVLQVRARNFWREVL